MGEQPLYTTKAHIFQIDPDTKKNWLPLSDRAVNVSFYYDNSRQTYRIISIEGSKAVVNSTVTSNMTFTRTSNKFGQWPDLRANTVYGLGFESETDLKKFIEKFVEVRELTSKRSSSKHEINGSLSDDAQSNSDVKLRSSSLSSSQSDSSSTRERPYSTSAVANHNTTSLEAQLRYENDRLKLALAQSSANAKKWEVELQTLKNNNARLTTALQESTVNVEEWKKQLTAYKEESARHKKKIEEMEKKQVSEETTALLEQEVATLTANLETTDQELEAKDEEIAQLKEEINELRMNEVTIKTYQSKVLSMERESQMMKTKLQHNEDQVKEMTERHHKTKTEAISLATEINQHFNDVHKLHEKLLLVICNDSES